MAATLRQKYFIQVQSIKAELSDEKCMCELIDVINNNQRIHILVNNAGYGSGAEFFKLNFSEHLRMIQVHIVASIRLIYAVLPQMMKREEGTIINVSSLGAYTPGHGNTVYSATKLFLTSFSESLFMEVQRWGIKIKCICPGFTHTDFHERRCTNNLSNTAHFMWMDPGDVVKLSVKSLNKKSVVYIPGLINKVIKLITSLLPRRLYYFLMERSSKAKIQPCLVNQIKHFVEKPVSFLFAANTDKV